MAHSVKIKYDPEMEFMEIIQDGKIIFFGNYWEFKSDPTYLHAFFNHMGIETDLKEYSL